MQMMMNDDIGSTVFCQIWSSAKSRYSAGPGLPQNQVIPQNRGIPQNRVIPQNHGIPQSLDITHSLYSHVFRKVQLAKLKPIFQNYQS